MKDPMQSEIANRVQITSDGLKLYVNAVIDAFAADVDPAQLVKYYGSEPGVEAARRYSPAVCTSSGPELSYP